MTLESLSCYVILRCFFGEPCSLLPSLKKGGGRSGGPQGDSRLTEFFICGSHTVFATWEAGLTDTALPSLSDSEIIPNVI